MNDVFCKRENLLELRVESGELRVEIYIVLRK